MIIRRADAPAELGTSPTSLVVQCGFVVTMMCCVALVIAPIFDSDAVRVPLCGSAVAAAALAAVVGRRGASLAVAIVVGFAGAAVMATALAIGWRWPAADAGDGGGDFVRSLASVWIRLLTVGVPASPTPDLLVGPVLVIFTLSYIACLLAIRTQVVLAPLGPCLVGLVLALLLAASPGADATWVVVSFMVAAFALTAVRADPTASVRARATAGVVVGALLAIVAGAAAQTHVVPGDHRADPRELVRPPALRTVAANPLEEIKRQLQTSPPSALFTLRVPDDKAARIDRVTTAVLTEFDGARWVDSSPFQPSGVALPDDPSVTSSRTAKLAADVTIDQLRGPFLPVLGRPTSVEGVTVAFEPATGGLVVESWPAGLSYSFTSEVPRPSESELAEALPRSGEGVARYLPPEDQPLPEWLRTFAESVVGTGKSPYAQLVALQAYLRDGRFPYDIQAPPGHSLAVIERMLRGDDPRFRSSYSEQHASAFALLARALGFPTRIAVGYLLEHDDETEPGVFRVTSRQAHAWPEVAFEKIGWVPFEPTDVSKLDLSLPPPPFDRPEDNPASRGPQETSDPPVIRPELAPRSFVQGLGLSRPVLVLLLIAFVMAGSTLIALVLAALVVAAKARRRLFRRRTGSAADRISGAWDEVLDRLAERGLFVSRALTVAEVAHMARDHFAARSGSGSATPPDDGPGNGLGLGLDDGLGGGAPDSRSEYLERLGSMVSVALFAGPDPTAKEAQDAWETQEVFQEKVRLAESRAARLRALVNIRPLLPATVRRDGSVLRNVPSARAARAV